MERTVRPGEFYRHFKNKLYQIIAVAEHSETGERMVVYQALYGDYRIYVRPYEMFVSEVDHEKYPGSDQRYRFERVEPGRAAQPGETMESGKMMEPGKMMGSGRTWDPGMGADPGNVWEAREAGAEREQEPNPQLLRFLEADTFEERMECLKKLSETAVQSDLDSLYVVLDIRPQEGSVKEQTERIAQQLFMQNRYDGNRLR